MPTLAQRIGDFSGSPLAVRDPATGLPFVGNVIPLNQISEQAKALLGVLQQNVTGYENAFGEIKLDPRMMGHGPVH